jgi:hypothetical protein
MESPCINVCVIDPASRQCVGCGRTISEIAAWASLSPRERRAVMTELETRAGPHRLAHVRQER